MICEKLVARAVSANARQTLNVHLDLISSERLARALSTGSALARWLWDATPISGVAARNHAMVRRVQNAYKVHLGHGIHGSLFIVNEVNGPSFWRFQQHPQKRLLITVQKTAHFAELEFKSIEQTGKSTDRFASVSESCGPTLFFCLRAQTWRHFSNACGLRGLVPISPPSRQSSLWSSQTMWDLLQEVRD